MNAGMPCTLPVIQHCILAVRARGTVVRTQEASSLTQPPAVLVLTEWQEVPAVLVLTEWQEVPAVLVLTEWQEVPFIPFCVKTSTEQENS